MYRCFKLLEFKKGVGLYGSKDSLLEFRESQIAYLPAM